MDAAPKEGRSIVGPRFHDPKAPHCDCGAESRFTEFEDLLRRAEQYYLVGRMVLDLVKGKQPARLWE